MSAKRRHHMRPSTALSLGSKTRPVSDRHRSWSWLSSLNCTNVHVKRHMNSSNGLSRRHECNRQTNRRQTNRPRYKEMCSNRRNRLRRCAARAIPCNDVSCSSFMQNPYDDGLRRRVLKSSQDKKLPFSDIYCKWDTIPTGSIYSSANFDRVLKILILTLNFPKRGFSASHFAFVGTNFPTTGKFSDKFLTAQNLEGANAPCPPCHDA